MNDSGWNISGDGRITVMLYLLFSLLGFDLIFQYRGFLFNGNKINTSGKEICFVAPDKLVIEICPEAERGQAPARYTPFLFKPIPINSANKDMLMTVNGVGPALADTIISYRKKNGPFKTYLDLQNLRGVGARRAARLKTEFTFVEEP